MTDRPAAELLARWEALEPWRDKITFQARYDYTAILTRLARAEQALAEAEANAWDRGYFAQCHCGCLQPTLGGGYATACPGCGNSYPCRTAPLSVPLKAARMPERPAAELLAGPNGGCPECGVLWACDCAMKAAIWDAGLDSRTRGSCQGEHDWYGRMVPEPAPRRSPCLSGRPDMTTSTCANCGKPIRLSLTYDPAWGHRPTHAPAWEHLTPQVGTGRVLCWKVATPASQGGQMNKCPAGGDHESQWFEDEQSWRCLRCGRYFSNDAPVRASQGGQHG